MNPSSHRTAPEVWGHRNQVDTTEGICCPALAGGEASTDLVQLVMLGAGLELALYVVAGLLLCLLGMLLRLLGCCCSSSSCLLLQTNLQAHPIIVSISAKPKT